MRIFSYICANKMELQENSVIIDDRLDRMLEPELGGHFTHAYCEAGQCEVTFNGQTFTLSEGGCMIIIANRLVSRFVPSKDFKVAPAPIFPRRRDDGGSERIFNLK